MNKIELIEGLDASSLYDEVNNTRRQVQAVVDKFDELQALACDAPCVDEADEALAVAAGEVIAYSAGLIDTVNAEFKGLIDKYKGV